MPEATVIDFGLEVSLDRLIKAEFIVKTKTIILIHILVDIKI